MAAKRNRITALRLPYCTPGLWILQIQWIGHLELQLYCLYYKKLFYILSKNNLLSMMLWYFDLAFWPISMGKIWVSLGENIIIYSEQHTPLTFLTTSSLFLKWSLWVAIKSHIQIIRHPDRSRQLVSYILHICSHVWLTWYNVSNLKVTAALNFNLLCLVTCTKECFVLQWTRASSRSVSTSMPRWILDAASELVCNSGHHLL